MVVNPVRAPAPAARGATRREGPRRGLGAAVGLPVEEYRIFFGKKGDTVAGAHRMCQIGGAMVDHGQLDIVAREAERREHLTQRPGGLQRFGLRLGAGICSLQASEP